jgi:hypothetical protein
MCSDKGREFPCVPIELDFQSRRVSVGSGLVKSRGDLPADLMAIAFVLLASIVGNKPKAVSFVIGANVARGYTVPPSIIPERGQVPENSSEPGTKEAWCIFHDCELRSKLVNEASIFTPQSRTVAIDARASASKADILAREPAADDIDGNSVSGQSVGCEFSDIFVLPHVGPVLRQDAAAEGIDLAKCDGFEAASALQAKVEAADAGKQGKDAQFHVFHPRF